MSNVNFEIIYETFVTFFKIVDKCRNWKTQIWNNWNICQHVESVFTTSKENYVDFKIQKIIPIKQLSFSTTNFPKLSIKFLHPYVSQFIALNVKALNVNFRFWKKTSKEVQKCPSKKIFQIWNFFINLSFFFSSERLT